MSNRLRENYGGLQRRYGGDYGYFWQEYDSGAGHRTRWFKVETFQIGSGEERSWFPERGWK